jgi:putative redox protein
MSEGKLVGRARARIGTTPYAVTIDAGHHTIGADEPKALGGGDTAPGPFDLVMSGLGACTAITLRMYAERKQWPLRAVNVDLKIIRDDSSFSVQRSVTLDGDLNEEQRARIAEIAERTPVTLALKSGMTIVTQFRP